eukprot:gene8557-380_t
MSRLSFLFFTFLLISSITAVPIRCAEQTINAVTLEDTEKVLDAMAEGTVDCYDRNVCMVKCSDGSKKFFDLAPLLKYETLNQNPDDRNKKWYEEYQAYRYVCVKRADDQATPQTKQLFGIFNQIISKFLGIPVSTIEQHVFKDLPGIEKDKKDAAGSFAALIWVMRSFKRICTERHATLNDVMAKFKQFDADYKQRMFRAGGSDYSADPGLYAYLNEYRYQTWANQGNKLYYYNYLKNSVIQPISQLYMKREYKDFCNCEGFKHWYANTMRISDYNLWEQNRMLKSNLVKFPAYFQQMDAVCKNSAPKPQDGTTMISATKKRVCSRGVCQIYELKTMQKTYTTTEMKQKTHYYTVKVPYQTKESYKKKVPYKVTVPVTTYQKYTVKVPYKANVAYYVNQPYKKLVTIPKKVPYVIKAKKTVKTGGKKVTYYVNQRYKKKVPKIVKVPYYVRVAYKAKVPYYVKAYVKVKLPVYKKIPYRVVVRRTVQVPIYKRVNRRFIKKMRTVSRNVVVTKYKKIKFFKYKYVLKSIKRYRYVTKYKNQKRYKSKVKYLYVNAYRRVKKYKIIGAISKVVTVNVRKYKVVKTKVMKTLYKKVRKFKTVTKYKNVIKSKRVTVNKVMTKYKYVNGVRTLTKYKSVRKSKIVTVPVKVTKTKSYQQWVLSK